MSRREVVLDVAAVAGMVLVSVGAALVYPPAGLIAAGVLVLTAAWLYVRGARGAPIDRG